MENWATMQAMINATASITTISGLIRIPGVSSSKNLSKPAPAAGMGAPDCLLFFLLLIAFNPEPNLIQKDMQRLIKFALAKGSWFLETRNPKHFVFRDSGSKV